MLNVTAAAEDLLQVTADLLVIPVFKGGIEGPGAGQVRDALGLDALPVTPAFRGDIGQHLLLAAPGAAARAARHAGRVATTLAQVHASQSAVAAIAEGFHLGAHDDRRFFSGEPDAPARLREVVVLVPSTRLAQARAALEQAAIYARATLAARDLVNLPPGHKQPTALAAAVADLVGGSCDVSVRDAATLAAEGFGGILAVGRGSSSPPCLVEVRYRPPSPLGHVVLVGKGVTFDSGGLSLKRGTGMATMKSDMAGVAAVAAACSVLAELSVRLEVTALLPLAENMPGADAQRPQDVVTIHGGTRVEVLDTDAEGRLLLADALDYARSLAPDAIVDLATLTGSAVKALGQLAAAAMGTDEDLLDALRSAAAVAGEPLWTLPLWPDLEHLLDTPVADMTNTGDGAEGGAIMAGLFLKRFAGDVPWAHLDIAGPAFLPPKLAGGYLPSGGTGFGVRTLLAWLQRRTD